MLKIFITGCHGQVGWELMRTLAPLGHVLGTDMHNLDLSNEQAIREQVRSYRPDIIVNAAAYTAVDQAEKQTDISRVVNADACKILAEEARDHGALLIHYSTDYVFDGNAKSPYTENVMPAPINVYGATKLAGEKAIQEVGAAHYIFRTSWVYGVRGKNFLHTMLRLGQERSQLKVVNDQFGAPTWARLLAEATAQVITKANTKSLLAPPTYGVYHMTCGGTTTWYEFACAIFRIYKAICQNEGREGFSIPEVLPIATSEYPVPAKRPAYGVLDNSRLQAAFGLQLSHWEDALNLCLQDLMAVKPIETANCSTKVM